MTNVKPMSTHKRTTGAEDMARADERRQEATSAAKPVGPHARNLGLINSVTPSKKRKIKQASVGDSLSWFSWDHSQNVVRQTNFL